MFPKKSVTVGDVTVNHPYIVTPLPACFYYYYPYNYYFCSGRPCYYL